MKKKIKKMKKKIKEIKEKVKKKLLRKELMPKLNLKAKNYLKK